MEVYIRVESRLLLRSLTAVESCDIKSEVCVSLDYKLPENQSLV